MPYTPPVSSDINFTVAGFTPPVTSDINFNLDPLTSYSLVVQDATQAQTADNVTLTVKYALTVANATQAQTADNVTLTVKYALTVADATQAQTADNVDLVFHGAAPSFSLVVQDATQAQVADNVDLTFNPPGGNVSPGILVAMAYNAKVMGLRIELEQEKDDEEVMAILYG